MKINQKTGQNLNNQKSKRQKSPTNVKSQLKESRIYIGDQCCSKHYACIQNTHKNYTNIEEEDSFSVNSELLIEYQPLEISAEPIIQVQARPEVNMLSMMNIKKKKYEKLIQKCENDLKEEQLKKNNEKLAESIKEGLKRSKKEKIQPKNKWNHSIFNQNMKNDEHQEQKRLIKTDIIQVTQQQKKKVPLKPIYERIVEYRSLQHKKNQDEHECQLKNKVLKPQLQSQIANNAKKILEEIRLQKIKKQEERKIIQAKIRALQIKSRAKVQRCKKKNFQGGEDFDLGDSQYSTFEARAENRKMKKKEKKERKRPQENQNKQAQTNQYGPKNFLKRSSSSLLNLKPKKQPIKKAQLDRHQPLQNKQEAPEPIKGPFFIWNIPIKHDDIETLKTNINKSEFLNIDRFNYKSGKTFREEANEYLAEKMQKKMMNHNEQIKKKTFFDQVQIKKEFYLSEFNKQQMAPFLREAIWNEDQIFKPNVLENFHFYAKTHSVS